MVMSLVKIVVMNIKRLLMHQTNHASSLPCTLHIGNATTEV